jgi:hypothetical protein
VVCALPAGVFVVLCMHWSPLFNEGMPVCLAGRWLGLPVKRQSTAATSFAVAAV